MIDTDNKKPSGMLGIRHVALFVNELETAVDFYIRIMGMTIECVLN